LSLASARSATSVQSRWVRAEATLADRNSTLMPAMIELCYPPIMFELMHTTDLSQWNRDPNDVVWQTYLSGLRRLVDAGGPSGRHGNGARRGSATPRANLQGSRRDRERHRSRDADRCGARGPACQIVLCSPPAAKSKCVNEEIRAF
jgi:hypothetical protein